MPLVAYDTSDDEDSQGDEKIESTSSQPSSSTAILPAKVVSVPVKGLGNQVKNQSSGSGQSLSNRQSGTLNGLPVPGSASSDYNDGYGIEDDDNGGNVDFLSSTGKQMDKDDDDDLESIESSSKLLGKLPGKKPNPTSSILTAGLNDIVVVDKKSKKVRVVIPSLDELEYASEEEEEEELALKRKIISSSKSGGGGGCSLSSFLPKPKNVRSGSSSSLFSSVTTNSSSPSSNIPVKSVTSLVPHSVSRPKANIPAPRNVITESNAESKPIGLDFFSLDEVPKKSTETHLNTHIESIKPIVISKPEIEEQPTYTEGANYYAYPQPASSTSSSSQKPKFHPSTADINDMDYKKFIASKFGEETADKIDIVEVDVKSYLANETELIKSISMESGGTVAGPAPSSLAKRKNQITYLAYQAKQREVDLKNEASNNRFTKSQTRAKYGF